MVFGFNCVEHCAVKRIKPLVAASARAGVENRVRAFARIIRVTRIYFAEIGQERDEFAVSLVNSVADFVNFADFVPRKNITDFGVF